MIELDHVTRLEGSRPIVDDLSLRVPEGELVVLLGESGSGKSTTLKMINRLVEPSRGTVRVGGVDVASVDPNTLRRGIGYALQGVGLFPHLSVAQNIAVVPRLLGWPAAQVRERVDELLALVGLDRAMGARLPSTLSGGQAQRVGVARALAARPRVLLLDEPFGALDPLIREELQQQLRGIHRRLGLTTVLVTHDMSEALLLADRLAVLHHGRLVAVDRPQVLLATPPHPQVERLLSAPRRQAEAVRELVEGR